MQYLESSIKIAIKLLIMHGDCLQLLGTNATVTSGIFNKIKTILLLIIIYTFSQSLTVPYHWCSPLMQHANCISLGIIVTCFVCIAHKLVSSKRATRYALHASCRHLTASIVNHRPKWISPTILCTNL